MIPEYRIDIRMKDGSLVTIPRGRVEKVPENFGFLLFVSDFNEDAGYWINWDEVKMVKVKRLDEEEQ